MKTHLEELLSGYVDEQLTQRERARVEDHLAGCAECRAELEGLRAFKERLSEVNFSRPMDMSPEFFWSQVRRRIEQKEARDSVSSSSGGIFGALLWRRLAFTAVAAVVVIGIGIALFQGKSPHTPDSPVAAFVEVDEASTKVPNGEVAIANVGSAVVIAAPNRGVEILDYHGEAENTSTSAVELDDGGALIQIMGAKDEGERPREM